MFPRNILTILKVSSFLYVLATKMVHATNGTHLRMPGYIMMSNFNLRIQKQA
jgi:hypothetical protein